MTRETAHGGSFQPSGLARAEVEAVPQPRPSIGQENDLSGSSPSDQDAVVAALEFIDVIEIQTDRRWFHMYPELSGQEHKTAERIASRLGEVAVDGVTRVADTGVCAWIRGAQPGRTVLLRADIDAFPVSEADRGHSYRSRVEGAHHACGHDGHISILLGVARMLAKAKETLAGNFVLIFQPAEEFGGGAARCLEGRPWPEDLEPDHSLGLHIWNELPAGTVDVTDGPVMCGARSFEVTFSGDGGHAAEPHLTRDPIVGAASFVSGLQTLVSRELDPTHVGLITVARIVAGKPVQTSRIAEQATLGGTIRAMKTEVMDYLAGRVEQFAVSTGSGFGLRTSATVFDGGYPPCSNDPAVANIVRTAAVPAVGAPNLTSGFQSCGSDDMSVFLQHYPGCYFFVGGRGPQQDSESRAHTPTFDFDERALETGAKVLAASAVSLAGRRKAPK